MKTSKSAKIKRAETIISKLVDLQALSNQNMSLQTATRAVRYYIEKLRNG
jgi:hypothetical protein